jgi:hypothetical protein
MALRLKEHDMFRPGVFLAGLAALVAAAGCSPDAAKRAAYGTLQNIGQHNVKRAPP